MDEIIVVDGFNFIRGEDGPRISGLEICRQLGYSNPSGQADRIWKNNKIFLEPYSTTPKLRVVGKMRDVRCYDEIGARFFVSQCRIKDAKKITLNMIRAFVTVKDQFKYIARKRLPWTKRFKDEFFQEIYKLNGWIWKGPGARHPSCVGGWIREFIYERFPEGILEELDRIAPRENGELKYPLHTLLTEDMGVPELENLIFAMTGLMRGSDNWEDFRIHATRMYPRRGEQLPFLLTTNKT